MSNKSPSISLPQGGGAISGMGEKFSADLFTGTGNFSVPIALPAGRNGLSPQLSLGYSTGNGNGPFGLGWSMSVPGVMRKTDKGIPQYNDDEDIFILSGAEDLIPIKKSTLTDANNAVTGYTTLYRPRTEGLFARIEHIKDSKLGNFWQVKSKDGLTSYYGSKGIIENDPCIISDPNNRGHICSWQLSRTVDLFGNHIIYSYERDLRYTQPHVYDQLYLKSIQYGDYGDPLSSSYMHKVVLVYEERIDAFSSYKQGFEIRTAKRCNKLQVYSYAASELKSKTYHFTYLDQNTPEELLPLNRVSMLASVQIEGHNGVLSEWMPPLEMRYSGFNPSDKRFLPVEGYLPSEGLANPQLELVDLTGNGLPDILEMNGSVRWYRNTGNAKFSYPIEMHEAPAGLSLGDPDVQMLDANGDGRADLLVNKPGLAGYFSTRFGGGWDKRYFQQYALAPSFSFSDPQVRLMDIDGDGITDAMRIGAQSMECFYNHPQKGFYKTTMTGTAQLDGIGSLSFADQRIRLADMSGDGMQDIVMINGNQVSYWPNLGYGRFGKRIIMRGSISFPYDFDPRRLLLGDIDGDGCADLIYVENGFLRVWMNRSGNSWSDLINIKGTPPVSDMDNVRLSDITGSGVNGVLWTGAMAADRKTSFYLDFTAGNKPYLMQKMDNNMGSLTRVEYKSSLYYYLEDEKHPETKWKTELPFPVLVVSRVESIDRISGGKLATEYRYHHGYWDGYEREFRGFGRVEQLDTESFERFDNSNLPGMPSSESVSPVYYTPPMLTKTWFHQGAMGEPFGGFYEADYSNEYWINDPQGLSRPEETSVLLQSLRAWDKRDALRTLRGTTLRSEVYARDGSALQDIPYTVTESVSGVREEAMNADKSLQKKHRQYRIFFPYSFAQRTTQWERGNDPMTSVSLTGRYDEYGQVLESASLGVPRAMSWKAGGAPTKKYLASLSKTGYIYSDTVALYITDRKLFTKAWDGTANAELTAIDYLKQILKAAAQDNVTLPLIGHTLNYYDGTAFTGLNYGQLGSYGALVRSETLILTPSIISDAYVNTPILLDSAPVWTADYPQDFRDAFLQRSGYTYYSSEPYTTGYYTQSRTKYDFQDGAVTNPKGLVTQTKDPYNNLSTIEYDTYKLLPVKVTDAQGMETLAEYDYRVLQPWQVTDPNGNRVQTAFTPLGLVEKTAVMGKSTESKGDTLSHPGSWLEYDFFNFMMNGDPVWVKTTQREHHYYDNINNDTITKIEYSDGFGRLVQTRTQAEDVIFGNSIYGSSGLPGDQDAPNQDAVGVQRSVTDPVNVVVSGWQVYNNKGKVVEKYEPYFVSKNTPVFTDSFVNTYSPWTAVGNAVLSLDNNRLKITGLLTSDYAMRLFQTEIGKTYRLKYTLDLASVANVRIILYGVNSIGVNQVTYLSRNYNTSGSYVFEFTATTPICRIRLGKNIADGLTNHFFLEEISAEKYTAGYSAWDFIPPDNLQFGQKVSMFYDPRGQVIRTVNPDGTEQRVIFGVPVQMNLPEQFTPTPWESYIYDANDLGGITHPEQSAAYSNHWWTPSNTEVDALGRAIKTTSRLSYDINTNLSDTIVMSYRYDIRGNLLEVTDALGRSSFKYKYDLKPKAGEDDPGANVLWTEHIDSGIKRAFFDAMMRPVQATDAKGALALNVYDSLSRPLKLWAKDKTGETITLRQYKIYGDSSTSGMTWNTAKGQNLLGKLYLSYDEAGKETAGEYDFKGNLKYKIREVIDYSMIKTAVDNHDPSWNISPYRVDWTTIANVTLNARQFRTDNVYDALNRITQTTLPLDVTSAVRKKLIPAYNRAGALEKVVLDEAGTLSTYVENIAYNARGQRLLIAYGNGVMTRYVYDEKSFRLLRMKSEKYIKTGLTYAYQSGTTRQDCAYVYDLIGNILTQKDRTPQCGVGGTDNIDKAFSYDAIYRLLSATGRENGLTSPLPKPWNDYTRSEAAVDTKAFSRQFIYDKMGNMLSLQHTAASPFTSFTRSYTVPSTNNKMSSWSDGAITYDLSYDSCGNILSDNQDRHYEWDWANNMRVFRNQVAGNEPTVFAQYLYDAGGNRVMKVVRNGVGDYVWAAYIDGVFEFKRDETAAIEQNLIHITDGGSRIAQVRLGNSFGDTTPTIQYILSDQVNSVSANLDDTGAFVNREEYYPYGETAFGSYAKKRYRFCGKERDEESSLYYYGARYYLPWLCRFSSVDPKAAKYNYQSSYAYASNNPVMLQDFNGEGTGDGEGGDKGGGDKSNTKPTTGNGTDNLKTVGGGKFNSAGKSNIWKAPNGGDMVIGGDVVKVKKDEVLSFKVNGTTYNATWNADTHKFMGYYSEKGNLYNEPKEKTSTTSKTGSDSKKTSTAPTPNEAIATTVTLGASELSTGVSTATAVAVLEVAAVAVVELALPALVVYEIGNSSTRPIAEPVAVPTTAFGDPNKEIRIALGTDQDLLNFATQVEALPYLSWEEYLPKTASPEAYSAAIIALGRLPNVTFHFNLSTPNGRVDDPINLQVWKNKITVAEYNTVMTLFKDRTTFYVKSGSIYKKVNK